MAIERKKTRIENIDGKDIIFKHFSDGNNGRPTFSLRLSDESAAEFRDGGWPVKSWIPKPSDNNPNPSVDPIQFLDIKLYYKGKDTDPKVVVKDTRTGKKEQYTEDTIGRLDKRRINNAQMEIHPWYCDTKQYQGWCISLDRLYVEISSDSFDSLFDVNDPANSDDDEEPWS